MYKILLAAALLIASSCYTQDTVKTKTRLEDTSATKKALENAHIF